MTFEEILDQAIAMLQRHRAVPCHGHDVLAAPDGSGAGAGGIGSGREEDATRRGRWDVLY